MRIPGLDLALADPDALPWRPTRHPGVAWIPLHPSEEEVRRARRAGRGSGETTVLVRMDPGRGYPPHRHLGLEEVLILVGGYRDERGEHGPGSYLRYGAGSEHAPVATGDPARPVGPGNPACVLFAVARGGVADLGSF